MEATAHATDSAESRFRFDVFLSHSHGLDTQHRDNHQRVVRLARNLEALGLKVWIDEDHVRRNILDQCFRGIEDAETTVVCVSQTYLDKVAADADSYSKNEFNYARNRKGSQKMIAAVMEEHLRNERAWTGPVAVLASNVYVPMWTEEDIDGRGPRKLAEAIRRSSPTTHAHSQGKRAGGAACSTTGASPRLKALTYLQDCLWTLSLPWRAWSSILPQPLNRC